MKESGPELNKAKIPAQFSSIDPYVILGVNKTMTIEEIKKSKNALYFKYHADTASPENKGIATLHGADIVEKIQDAYELIKSIHKQVAESKSGQNSNEKEVKWLTEEDVRNTIVHTIEDNIMGVNVDETTYIGSLKYKVNDFLNRAGVPQDIMKNIMRSNEVLNALENKLSEVLQHKKDRTNINELLNEYINYLKEWNWEDFGITMEESFKFEKVKVAFKGVLVKRFSGRLVEAEEDTPRQRANECKEFINSLNDFGIDLSGVMNEEEPRRILEKYMSNIIYRWQKENSEQFLDSWKEAGWVPSDNFEEEMK